MSLGMAERQGNLLGADRHGHAPGRRPPQGGATVTITGTNLGPTTSIDFGSTQVPGFTYTATTCTVNSPAGTAGSVVDVTVTTRGGTSATGPADQFTYGAGPGAPVVRVISPNSEPSTGGTVVTITGRASPAPPGSISGTRRPPI